tara:strand:+ start:6793 stop:7233 length:441 start_codon:yes stop_codon:yes gene_type:complete
MKIEKIVFKNAVKIFLAIIAFFFLMKLLGLEKINELRILNFAFVFWGVNNAIKESIYLNKVNDYLQNLFTGLFTSIISVIFTIIAFSIYLHYIDPQFIKVVENSALWGGELTPSLISAAIFIEGMASSIICAFIVMQFWKNKKVPS